MINQYYPCKYGGFMVTVPFNVIPMLLYPFAVKGIRFLLDKLFSKKYLNDRQICRLYFFILLSPSIIWDIFANISPIPYPQKSFGIWLGILSLTHFFTATVNIIGLNSFKFHKKNSNRLLIFINAFLTVSCVVVSSFTGFFATLIFQHVPNDATPALFVGLIYGVWIAIKVSFFITIIWLIWLYNKSNNIEQSQSSRNNVKESIH